MKQMEKLGRYYDTMIVDDLIDKLNEAIDLINEQQAEIERLKGHVHGYKFSTEEGTYRAHDTSEPILYREQHQ